MSDDEPTQDVEALAALYALGHLQGAERTAFEKMLQEKPEIAAHLSKFQQVVEALSWSAPSQKPPLQLRKRLLERARQERAPASGRIELAPGILLVLAGRLAWRETGITGIQYKPLFVDPLRRYASSLVSMAPGTTYPSHRHTAVEELFMLSGDIRLDGYQLQSGDYCRSEADSRHQAIYTEGGATFIALASLDNEFLPAESPTAG